jgi:hypothetical protein
VPRASSSASVKDVDEHRAPLALDSLQPRDLGPLCNGEAPGAPAPRLLVVEVAPFQGLAVYALHAGDRRVVQDLRIRLGLQQRRVLLPRIAD